MAESRRWQVGLLPHLGANVYKVDRILTHKRTKGALRERVKYLVQWHGYGSDQWSWLGKADFVQCRGRRAEKKGLGQQSRFQPP